VTSPSRAQASTMESARSISSAQIMRVFNCRMATAIAADASPLTAFGQSGSRIDRPRTSARRRLDSIPGRENVHGSRVRHHVRGELGRAYGSTTASGVFSPSSV
jgi:hypothetical protein